MLKITGAEEEIEDLILQGNGQKNIRLRDICITRLVHTISR